MIDFLKGKNIISYPSPLCIVIFLLLSTAFVTDAPCKTTFETFFRGTDYELNIYRIQGRSPGKTLLLIGGIQGNEPGGFLSADLYADMKISKGNLIVVPRANFYSIVLNRRQINEDMNRKFSEPSKKNYEAEVVSILKTLIAESDCLLNLHDGSGFYADTWHSKMKNPMRYGQSIIVDCNSFTNPGTGTVWNQQEMAITAIEEINSSIENPEYHFHFNNHETSTNNTRHPEQRKSATYYAVYTCGVPAFGIETSKSLPLELRIYHHNLAINAFMKILDIHPEVPGIKTDSPSMKYLVARVNDQPPVVVANGDTLDISGGDTVRILHVEANYDRGLSADIKGYGSLNDMNRSFSINRSTRIVLRKDHHRFGTIYVAVNKKKAAVQDRKAQVIFFKMHINDREHYFPNGTHIDIIKGDRLKIVDVGTAPQSMAGIIVNFKGFVGNKKVNTGEDRGYLIHTDTDLWQRYSLYKKGRTYQVVVTGHQNRIIGRLFVDIRNPRFEYIVLQRNGDNKICYSSDDTITVTYSDTIKVIDVKTNIPGNDDTRIFVSGPHTSVPLKIGTPVVTSTIITPSDRGTAAYSITLKRKAITMGSIPLKIDESRLAYTHND